MAAWKKYQEEAATFFRELGWDAQTNVTTQGVRTKHDIDVLVQSKFAGFNVTWIVECKLWKTKVTKMHVLALREIVADTGADRGILLAEKGAQIGAHEAAVLTNVRITSLAEFRSKTRTDVLSMRLFELYERYAKCKERYWELPKTVRIECGLRPDVPEIGFSGHHVIEVTEQLLNGGIRGDYLVRVFSLPEVLGRELPKEFNSVEELVPAIEAIIDDFEHRIETCFQKWKAPDAPSNGKRQ